MVRFSDAELELVGQTAALAGFAVGAWIGGTALEVARSGGLAVGLPDLLRLHADVLVVQRAADRAAVGRVELLALVQRLEAAVDAMVADVGRKRS